MDLRNGPEHLDGGNRLPPVSNMVQTLNCRNCGQQSNRWLPKCKTRVADVDMQRNTPAV